MARTTKKDLATKPANTNLALLDDQLSQEVANLKSQIGQSSSNKLSVEPSGDFVLPDGMNLGSEIQVVVVDFASRNNFYLTPYNRDNPAPPDCYALGRVINDMAPEDDSPAKQNDICRTCPMNQFGSGQGGRSKACQNRRLVAVLLVDPDNPDAHNAPDAPIYVMDISPSNLRSFDGAIAHGTKALGHYVKVIYTVTGKNAGTYATVTWSDPVPNPDYAVHYARKGEVEDQLFRRPDYAAYEAKAAPAPARGRTAAAPRRASRR